MLHGLAIALLVVTGLLVVLFSIRKRKLCVNKGVIALVIIAGATLAFTNWQDSGKGPQQVQAEQPYNDKVPSLKAAPYWIQTPSRGYFVVEYYSNETHLVLQEYYSYDVKKWEHQTLPLFLDKSLTEYSGLK